MIKLNVFGAAILVSALFTGTSLAQSQEDATTPPQTDRVAPAPTIDTDEDGTPDAWDQRGDGRADSWDLDGDGRPDVFDRDGDGEADEPEQKNSAAKSNVQRGQFFKPWVHLLG